MQARRLTTGNILDWGDLSKKKLFQIVKEWDVSAEVLSGSCSCWSAAGGAVGCLALQPQRLQPLPCIKHVGLMSCDRDLNRGFLHGKRVFVALAKCTACFLRRTREKTRKQIQIKASEKRERERKKEGRKQPEFLVDILSTHPCVLFPSGRNKNCLCVFSRPFRKCYRAIIAQLSNSQSLFRLSLLPLPTWALPLTPPTLPPAPSMQFAGLL